MGWNAMREQIFANQKKLGVIPENTELTPWPTTCRSGTRLTADQKKLYRAPGRGVRRLCSLHRPRDRSRHPAGRGHGRARQHADHLHRRRQRHEPGGHAVRHPQPVDCLQRHPRHPGRGAAQILRRLGLGEDLSPHGGRLVMGLRHAVQVDQADRLALRRHPAGHGRCPGPTASRTPAAFAPSSTT